MKGHHFNSLKCFYSISILLLFSSCHETDFSNPKEVLTTYRKLLDDNNKEEIYDNYFSTGSKEIITRSEYLKSKSSAPSDSAERITSGIAEVTFDTVKSVYKTFNVKVATIRNADTTHIQLFYTLINEGGSWKIINTKPLITKAKEYLDKGEYAEVRNTTDKILKLDPFSAEARRLFAQSYLNDSSGDTSLIRNAVLDKIQEALKYEPANPSSYNVLAQYFRWTGDRRCEISAYREQLDFSPNKQYSGMIYSNLANLYFDIEEFKMGELCAQRSLAINPDDSYTLYTYGHYMLVAQQDYENAVKYLSKAVLTGNSEDYFRADLYFNYAYASFETGDCENATEYAEKAVALAPEHEPFSGYLALVKKYCIKIE